MSSWRLPAALLMSSCVCVVVAIVNRRVYPTTIGGLSSDALPSGWTAYAPIDGSSAPSRFDRVDIWDPYLWAGAAAALLIVALCFLAVSRARRPATGSR